MDLYKILSRKEIIQKSLDNFGYILIAENMDEAIEAANAIASEHLEIVTANPFEVMMKVRNAGAIFIGEIQLRAAGRLFCRTEPRTCRPTEQRNSSLLFL